MSTILAKFLAWKATNQPVAPKKPDGERYKNVFRKDEIIRRLQAGEKVKTIAADIGSDYTHLTKMVRSWGGLVWLTHEQIHALNTNGVIKTEDTGSCAGSQCGCDGRNAAGRRDASCAGTVSSCDCVVPYPDGYKAE